MEDRAGEVRGDSGLTVTVCHFPPGTSKWNKIEHRLFSAISTNWRGRPLVNHEVIVELIRATTTRCGLRVRAELDRGRYPLGIKVSDQELAAVPASRHTWHGGVELHHPSASRIAEQATATDDKPYRHRPAPKETRIARGCLALPTHTSRSRQRGLSTKNPR